MIIISTDNLTVGSSDNDASQMPNHVTQCDLTRQAPQKLASKKLSTNAP